MDFQGEIAAARMVPSGAGWLLCSDVLALSAVDPAAGSGEPGVRRSLAAAIAAARARRLKEEVRAGAG